MFLQGTWAWRVKIGQIEQKPRRRGGDVAFSVLWVPQIKIPSTHWDRRWMGIPSGVPGDLPISALWGLLFLLSSVPLPSACCPAGETAQRPVSLSICSLALWFLDWCAPCDQQAPRSGEFDWSVCYTKAGNVDGERISLMHRKLSVCAGEWQLAWEGGLFALETSSARFKTQQSLSVFTRGGKGIWLPS